MIALIYLTHSELYDGGKIHFQILKKRLRGLGRASILSNLAVINNLYAHSEFFGKGLKDLPAIQRLLKSSYFRDEVNAAIDRKGLQDRVVFVRLQNLYLARLAILYSTDAKPVLVDGKTQGGFELGDCCLVASDYLLSKQQTEDTGSGTDPKRVRHLGFQLSPGTEISNPLDMTLGIVRSEIIYSQILQSLELKDVLAARNLSDFDVGAEFEKVVGITLTEYIDITVGILSYLLTPDAEGNVNSIRSITVDTFLSQSTLRREALLTYLALESRSVDFLRTEFTSQSNYLDQFSFLPFKTYPLIEIQAGLYFCIDSFFLAEKLNTGLYWKIFDSLSSKKRETFSNVYGHIFEIYVRRLIRSSISEPTVSPKKGLLFSSPPYENDHESFDEIIYYPETKHLIVIETKASFIHTVAKFGRSIRRFQREIMKKFVAKEDGTGKGVGQLVKHIGHLFNKNKNGRRHTKNAELDRWIQSAEKVSPVIVVQEPLLSFHIIESWLNEKFRELLNGLEIRESVSIAQLTILDVETLESLKPHLISGEVTLEQCLNFRNYRDPDYKNYFASMVYANFNLRRRLDAETGKISQHVFDRAKNRFFSE